MHHPIQPDNRADHDSQVERLGNSAGPKDLHCPLWCGAVDDLPLVRRFRRVLYLLAALCLVLAVVVWWQLLRELP
jgi:hypothetical protein